MTVYRIAKWNEVFLKSESRKLKHLGWVSLPVAFDSTGYQSLLDEFDEDAAAIYGAWCALVLVGCSCSVRGVLANSRGNPLRISHIARITGLAAANFERLIAWASRDDVGWLVPMTAGELAEIVESDQVITGPNDTPGDSPGDLLEHRGNLPKTRHNTTVQDRTGHNKTSLAAARAADADFESLDGQEVLAVCRKLWSALESARNRTMDRETVWGFACVSELVRPGFLAEVATKVRNRDVNKPKSYIEKALREECSLAGTTLTALLAAVPPVPAPEPQLTSQGV